MTGINFKPGPGRANLLQAFQSARLNQRVCMVKVYSINLVSRWAYQMTTKLRNEILISLITKINHFVILNKF